MVSTQTTAEARAIRELLSSHLNQWLTHHEILRTLEALLPESALPELDILKDNQLKQVARLTDRTLDHSQQAIGQILNHKTDTIAETLMTLETLRELAHLDLGENNTLIEITENQLINNLEAQLIALPVEVRDTHLVGYFMTTPGSIIRRLEVLENLKAEIDNEELISVIQNIEENSINALAEHLLAVDTQAELERVLRVSDNSSIEDLQIITAVENRLGSIASGNLTPQLQSEVSNIKADLRNRLLTQLQGSNNQQLLAELQTLSDSPTLTDFTVLSELEQSSQEILGSASPVKQQLSELKQEVAEKVVTSLVKNPEEILEPVPQTQAALQALQQVVSPASAALVQRSQTTHQQLMSKYLLNELQDKSALSRYQTQLQTVAGTLPAGAPAAPSPQLLQQVTERLEQAPTVPIQQVINLQPNNLLPILQAPPENSVPAQPAQSVPTPSTQPAPENNGSLLNILPL